MLYISTTDRTDSFTSYRVLNTDRTADGGKFVPMQLPHFSQKELLQMKEKSFGEVVAMVLNLFFDKNISGWDIDFRVGRSPYKLAVMNHRLIVVQLWCNHGADYCYFERSIYEILGGTAAPGKPLPQWAQIAIRIAVLFGVYSELHRRGNSSVDIALPADSFTLTNAVWYACDMGLPVGKIICGCDEGSGIWDLIHRGEFSTAAAPDGVLAGVERLIFDAFGREETRRYLDVLQHGGIYQLAQEQCEVLENRLFAAVTSTHRQESLIKSVARTNDFILDPSTAGVYGALQDYRSRTGESKTTVIIADKSPVLSVQVLKRILGISDEELKRRVNTEKE